VESVSDGELPIPVIPAEIVIDMEELPSTVVRKRRKSLLDNTAGRPRAGSLPTLMPRPMSESGRGFSSGDERDDPKRKVM
jgi:hypothetical protein